MKRLKKILLNIATFGALFAGISVANAGEFEWPNNGVTCYQQTGGAYPQDGSFYYCGAADASHVSVLNSLKTALLNNPQVSAKLVAPPSGPKVTFFVFRDPIEAARWNTSVQDPPDADLQVFYNTVINEAGRSYQAPANVTFIFERLATGVYPQVSAPLAAGVIQHTGLHEMGHQYDYALSAAAQANAATFSNFVAKDQSYMDIIAGTATANSLRATYDYFIGPGTFTPWRELFAEEFAKMAIQQGASGTQNAVAAAAITPYFQCSAAYVRGYVRTGGAPDASDFAAFNTANDPNVNYRCNTYRAPVVPAGCTLYMQTALFPYPYHPGTGNYVYCGSTPATYRFPAGDYLKDRLPNSTGSSFLRDKFENSNITLYVFTSAAAAQAKLGVANIPNVALDTGATGLGILGWTQTNPQPIAGQTPNKFIAVWETYRPFGAASTSLVAVETTVATDGTPNRFRSGVSQQAGRMTDYLSGSLNSTTALSQRAIFATAFTKDQTAFNAKATCTVFIAPVCVGGVVQAPYTGKTNWQILTTLYPDLTGTAGINTNQYLFAEQVPIIVFSTGGTANGGTRKPMDDRLFHFNNCTLLYTNTQYNFWRLPTTAELTAKNCQ